MKYFISIVLVILVFSTSLNRGQKLKSNNRRAAGLVPYPRIGRHLAMASFARADGNAGLVNYPRVGRSGSLASLSSFDPNGGHEFESESKNDNDRDFGVDAFDYLDYNGHHPSDWEESRKRFDELKNGIWLGTQANIGEKKEHRRQHRCNQQVDGPWAVLFGTRDFNTNQQPVHNFIPRLVRGVEHDAVSTNNVIS